MIDRRRALIGSMAQNAPQLRLLASGTYEQANSGSQIAIPVSYTGTPLYAYVKANPYAENTAQTALWESVFNLRTITNFADWYYDSYGICLARAANNTYVSTPQYRAMSLSDTTLTASQQSSAYPVLSGTYDWFIWGV